MVIQCSRGSEYEADMYSMRSQPSTTQEQLPDQPINEAKLKKIILQTEEDHFARVWHP